MLETGRENTHRGREWSMRAHDGVKGPTGQQGTQLSIPILRSCPSGGPPRMGAASAAYNMQSDGSNPVDVFSTSRRPCRLGVVVLRRSDTPLRAGGARSLQGDFCTLSAAVNCHEVEGCESCFWRSGIDFAPIVLCCGLGSLPQQHVDVCAAFSKRSHAVSSNSQV